MSHHTLFSSLGGDQPSANLPPPIQQQNISTSGSNTSTNGTAAQIHPPPPPAAPPLPFAFPPGFDMSVLQGITAEQFQAIASLFQATVPQAPPSQQDTTHYTTASAQQTLATSRTENRHDACADMDLDKEEGEVEESGPEQMAVDTSRDFLHAPPAGPRNMSPTEPREPAARTPTKALGLANMQSRHISDETPRLVSTALTKAGEDAAVKSFLTVMHDAGYTYGDIAQEVTDAKFLRSLYLELDLPIALAGSAYATPAPVKEPVPAPQKKPIAPKINKPPQPQSREEYLAKLQAAKNKRADPAVHPAASAASQKALVTQFPGAIHLPSTTASPRPIDLNGTSPARSMRRSAASAAQVDPLTSAPQSHVPSPARQPLGKNKTELLRQKMEKLKAEQAAKQQVQRSRGSGPPATSGTQLDSRIASPKSGLGAGMFDVATKAAMSRPLSTAPNTAEDLSPPAPSTMPNASASRTLNRGFGLPGLFAILDPDPEAKAVVAPPAATTEPTRSSLSRTGTHEMQIQRPFGKSISTDDFVIDFSSEEEDDDDAMDVDESEGPNKGNTEHISRRSSTLPTRPTALVSNGTSTAGTPSPGSPSTDLKRTLEQIEEFKRLIAVAERKKQKTILPRSATHSAPNTSGPNGTPVTASSQDVPSNEGMLTADETARAIEGTSAKLLSVPVPAATRLAREQEREILRCRLEELEQERARLVPGTPTGVNRGGAQLEPAGSLCADASVTGGIPVTKLRLDNSIIDASTLESTASTNSQGEASAAMATQSNDDDGADSSVLESSPSTNGNAVDNVGLNTPPKRDSDGNYVDDDDEDLYGDSADGMGDPAAGVSQVIDQSSDVGPAKIGSIGMAQTHLDGGRLQNSVAETALQEAVITDEDGDVDDMDDIYGSFNVETPVSGPLRVPPPATSSGRPTPLTATANRPDDEEDSAMDTSDSSSDMSSDSNSDVDNSDRDLVPPPPPRHYEPIGIASADVNVNVNAIWDSHDSVFGPNTNMSESEEDNVTSVNQSPCSRLQHSTEGPDAHAHEVSDRSFYFKPYGSILKSFKDYRWHREFMDTVPGGFRSLTYSRNLDPFTPLCPEELSTHGCTNYPCQYQHFRNLAVNDKELLRKMGTDRIPTTNAEEAKRWKQGLAVVIKSIRTAGEDKDVAAMSRRLSKYRQEFIGDETKVVWFDGGQ